MLFSFSAVFNPSTLVKAATGWAQRTCTMSFHFFVMATSAMPLAAPSEGFRPKQGATEPNVPCPSARRPKTRVCHPSSSLYSGIGGRTDEGKAPWERWRQPVEETNLCKSGITTVSLPSSQLEPWP